MTVNCYSDNYAIGNRIIHEGYGLDTFGGLFTWYYTERGERSTMKYFYTEEEAVEYAFKIISTDQFAKSHVVGFINDKQDEKELITELQNRSVEFWKDEIPYYSLQKMTTRIFVFGCDIKKVLDLQAKYAVKRIF